MRLIHKFDKTELLKMAIHCSGAINNNLAKLPINGELVGKWRSDGGIDIFYRSNAEKIIPNIRILN